MSSTNRNKERMISIDYYKTPVDAIDLFLSNWDYCSPHNHNIQILDPCAGGCSRFDMSYPVALKARGFTNIDTIDIREDSRAAIKMSYFDFKCPPDKYDLIITNPPFNIALQIIEQSLKNVKNHGLVVMLLRLNFFGSQQRKPFFKANMPIECLVHSKRMKFHDMGNGDSIEYMHCIWEKGVNPDHTKLKII